MLQNFIKKPKAYDVNSPYYRWEREWNGKEIQDEIQANIATQSETGFITPRVKEGEKIGIVHRLNVVKRGDSGKIIEMIIETIMEIILFKKNLL